MIKVNDFKPGITFLYENELLIVIESAHSKSGRGQAHVKAKVKNLQNGTIKTITFTGGDVVSPATVERFDAQFLYNENNHFIFMDTNTYDQFTLDEEFVKWEKNFFIEGEIVKLKKYKDTLLGVEIKPTITAKVTYTEPAVKGNTATGASKPATISTGFKLQVPLFVDNGDMIIINTIDGTYKSRA